MNRRSFLVSAATGAAVGTAGCVSRGRVVLKRTRTVTVEPEMGWWVELPDVSGNGALFINIRAAQPFDVYYFTDSETFDRYRTYVGGDEPDSMPSGHPEISQTAIKRGHEYGVTEPEEGNRRSISTEGEHYFVVDHSNYGMGVPVDTHGDPLNAFVDLKIIDEWLPI